MNELLERIESLSGPARDLLEQQIEAVEHAGASGPGRHRLVAYVTTNDALFFDRDEVRRFVAERLPEWMVPDVVLLEALPLLPNGKVDINALPEPGAVMVDESAYAPPQTEAQRTICGIWESVMGEARIGIHDNFFEMGGDSILSIQVVAKMRQAGFRVAPDLLFRHQSVAELAAAVELDAPAREDRAIDGHDRIDHTRKYAVPDAGDVPLTPIQSWFFEQEFERPEHWHQAVRIIIPDDVSASDLERALNAVVRRHDVFRLAFSRGEDGWRSEYVEEEEATDIELKKNAPPPAGLDASSLLFAALRDHGRGGRMLDLSIHHLIVDPVSWQILLEDLETAYDAIAAGKSPEFPTRSSSYRDWVEALGRLADSPDINNERAFWTDQVDRMMRPGIFDLDAGREADAQTLEGRLSSEETRFLMDDANGAYLTRTEDLLLAALVRTMAARFDTGDLPVGLERHGRQEVDEVLDLSRSVGWFAAYFPLVLPGNGDLSPAHLIPSVKECLRSVSRGGVGFGVLRYLHPDAGVRERFGRSGMPEILFNYSGRLDNLSAHNGRFDIRDSIYGVRDGSNHLSHALEINTYVQDGQLVTLWKTGGALLGDTPVVTLLDQFMQEVRLIIDHCMTPGSGHATPSDFPDANLTQEQLDRLLGNR